MAKYLTARGLGVLGTLDMSATRPPPPEPGRLGAGRRPARRGGADRRARTPGALEELLPAMTLELDEDQLARLDAASRP